MLSMLFESTYRFPEMYLTVEGSVLPWEYLVMYMDNTLAPRLVKLFAFFRVGLCTLIKEQKKLSCLGSLIGAKMYTFIYLYTSS